MIVNSISQGWEVIFQRAHGMLAAQIAFHWEIKNRPKRWIETILAVAGHDDAQLDFKGTQHITLTGAPLDFADREINLHQPKWNSNYAFQKSRWIGLLNSLHITFLYEPKRGKSKRMDEILDEQSALQAKLIASLGIDRNEAERAYRLLEWCDALSLILCRNNIPQEESKLKLGKGPENNAHYLWQKKIGKAIVIEPWCFVVDSFTVQVETRVLKQMTFKDDAELEEKLLESDVIERKWFFEKNW